MFLFKVYCYTITFVHNIFRPSKGCLVYDTMSTIFSVLNLTIIFIKAFTCYNTTFILFQWNYIFIKLFLLNTPSLAWWITNWWITNWLTGTASIHAFIGDIPSQMHPSAITLWQVILIFMFTFNIMVLANLFTIASCVETRLVFQSYLIHTDLQDVPHFDCLTLSNTFICNFLLVFLLAFMFPVIYLELELLKSSNKVFLFSLQLY